MKLNELLIVLQVGLFKLQVNLEYFSLAEWTQSRLWGWSEAI